MNNAVLPQDSWQQHVNSAVLKFLKTAVVIDNQPYVDSSAASMIEPPQNTGLNDDVEVLVVPEDGNSLKDIHNLDIRNITDAFINEGIAHMYVLSELT